MSTTTPLPPILARLDLVDPCRELAKNRLPLSARLAALTGKKVGLLDNRKDNADVILKRIAARLEQDYGTSTALYRTKPVYSRRAEAAVLDELAANCDLVITSTGA